MASQPRRAGRGHRRSARGGGGRPGVVSHKPTREPAGRGSGGLGYASAHTRTEEDPVSHQAGQSPASFYSSPQEALQAPPEELVYVACLHVGTGVDKPDFLAVVDVNPDSGEYGRIVHETPMPNTGDERHHYGWIRRRS